MKIKAAAFSFSFFFWYNQLSRILDYINIYRLVWSVYLFMACFEKCICVFVSVVGKIPIHLNPLAISKGKRIWQKIVIFMDLMNYWHELAPEAVWLKLKRCIYNLIGIPTLLVPLHVPTFASLAFIFIFLLLTYLFSLIKQSFNEKLICTQKREKEAQLWAFRFLKSNSNDFWHQNENMCLFRTCTHVKESLVLKNQCKRSHYSFNFN